MPDEEDGGTDVAVEELTLDDLREGQEERPKRATPGGLRAGGLGPEGSRYTPPEGPRRRTFKPVLAAFLLFSAGFLGIYLIGIQLTLEGSVEGETFVLLGEVVDYEDYVPDQKRTPVAGVNVTIDGVDGKQVTDSKGRFRFNEVPGGMFTIRFTKRSWDDAVNTRIVTYIFRDADDEENPIPFAVKVKDLDPDTSVPVTQDKPRVVAEVVDWENNDTAVIRVHASSFDQDLRDCSILVWEDGEDVFIDLGTYSNEVTYTFSGEGDQSGLFIKVLNPEGGEYTEGTEVVIPAHPEGAEGWKATAFPQVALFVRGGHVTAEDEVTIAVHSGGSTEYAYRVGSGDWTAWSALALGHAEAAIPLGAGEGILDIEFITRNATGVNGTPATVSVSVDRTPPTVEPAPAQTRAVTSWAVFDPGAEAASYISYQLPGGGWSPWLLNIHELVVPIDDSGNTATVTFAAMDRAGNVANGTGNVAVTHLNEYFRDESELLRQSLMFCIPVIIIGIILSFAGGYSAYKRNRYLLAMVGCFGALMATGFTSMGIIGPVITFVAMALVMFSREEFDLPGPVREERRDE